jgi:hypothetical protein
MKIRIPVTDYHWFEVILDGKSHDPIVVVESRSVWARDREPQVAVVADRIQQAIATAKELAKRGEHGG